MKVSLQNIKTFSQCPLSYVLAKKNKIILNEKSYRTKIITKVIKKAYLRHSETNFLVSWRTIIGWTDKIIFKNIDISNPLEYEKAKVLSENILSPLAIWYKEIYSHEKDIGFVDIPISGICGGVEIEAVIPLLKSSTPPTITYIDDIFTSKIQMYNDLLVRGLAWLVAKNLDIPAVRVEYLLIGPVKKFDKIEITCDKTANQRIEKVLGHIANSIIKGYTYPSITAGCNSCHFQKICEV